MQALYCQHMEAFCTYVAYAKHWWQYRACVVGATVLLNNLSLIYAPHALFILSPRISQPPNFCLYICLELTVEITRYVCTNLVYILQPRWLARSCPQGHASLCLALVSVCVCVKCILSILYPVYLQYSDTLPSPYIFAFKSYTYISCAQSADDGTHSIMYCSFL